MNLKDYNHPKASDLNFYALDYKEVDREIKDGWTIIYSKNSGGRIHIRENPPPNVNKLPNSYYPGGGCNFFGGMLACSFHHIDWIISPKKTEAKDDTTKEIR